MTAPTAPSTAVLHDKLAEAVILGRLMLGQPLAVDLEPGDFYDARHGRLFSLLGEAETAGVPAEAIALAGWLADQQELATVGGYPRLAELIELASAQPGTTSWYATRLRELADRRRLTEAAARITQLAEQPGATAERLAAAAEQIVRQAAPRSDSGLVSLGEAVSLNLVDIQMRPERAPGMPTGYLDLDRLLSGGLRAGMLVGVCGRPGEGKSTLLLDVMRSTCVRERYSGLLASLEMPVLEVVDRLLSAESGVPYTVIRSGALEEEDWVKIDDSAASVRDAPLWLTAASGWTVRQLRAAIHRLRQQAGRVDIVAVDYCQLVTASSARLTRQEAVAEVARDLKRLALEESLVVLMGVQMNRNKDARKDTAPVLSDIRESGEIENSCDLVVMIDRPDHGNPESTRAGEADFWVRKNRQGPSDQVVTVVAQLHRCRFKDFASGWEQSAPAADWTPSSALDRLQ